MKKETIIINLVGGPGVGKSIMAHSLTAFYAKRDTEEKITVESVTEYAKDLIWLEAKFFDELGIFAKQHLKITVVDEKVDLIITDAPLLLKLNYMDDNYDFSNIVVNTIDRYNNIFVFLERDIQSKFQETGRIHNLEESREIDNRLKLILEEYKYPYITVNGYVESTEEIALKIDKEINLLKERLKDPKYILEQKELAREREIKALLKILNNKAVKRL